MVKLKSRQWKAINDVFQADPGYILDFSNRTFEEFFEEEFGIEIYNDRYAVKGESKANRLRAFIELEPANNVLSVLDALWIHRQEMNLSNKDADTEKQIAEKYQNLINFISGGGRISAIPAFDQKITQYDFDTAKRDFDRALSNAASDPEDAITSACSVVESVCRSILIELEIPLPNKKDIKGLYYAVRSPLGLAPGKTAVKNEIADDVTRILGGLTTVVEGVGSLRTHGGDAHGRDRGYARIDERIATLAIHSASTVALFLIDTWQRKYPGRTLSKTNS